MAYAKVRHTRKYGVRPCLRKHVKWGRAVHTSCLSVRRASAWLWVWEAAEASDALNFGLRLRISQKVVCADNIVWNNHGTCFRFKLVKVFSHSNTRQYAGTNSAVQIIHWFELCDFELTRFDCTNLNAQIPWFSRGALISQACVSCHFSFM